jgi:hypothetical protein
MASSKSGRTKEERENLLRECGFVPAHAGKGSHEQWEHPELKALMKSRTIAVPANLLSNPAQKPWEETLPGDPASGTWHRISKYARWCQTTVAEIQAEATVEKRRRDICRKFRAVSQDYCQWKKDVRHWIKAGLGIASAPGPTIKYEELKALEARKKQFSAPSA